MKPIVAGHPDHYGTGTQPTTRDSMQRLDEMIAGHERVAEKKWTQLPSEWVTTEPGSTHPAVNASIELYSMHSAEIQAKVLPADEPVPE